MAMAEKDPIDRISNIAYRLRYLMQQDYVALPAEIQLNYNTVFTDLLRFFEFLEIRLQDDLRAAENAASPPRLPNDEILLGWFPVNWIPVWRVRATNVSAGTARFNDYVPPPDETEVVVFLDEYDEAQLKAVQNAAFKLADELGYRDFTLTDEQIGSIFRKFAGKVESGLASDHVQQKMQEIETRTSIEVVGRAQAQNDAIKTASAVNLIASLANIPNAVVRVGGLLILKQTNADGVPSAIIRELSIREVRALENNPGIQKDPHRALELLALAVAQLEEEEH